MRDHAVRRGEGAGVRHVAPRGHDLLVRVHLRRHVCCTGGHGGRVARGHRDAGHGVVVLGVGEGDAVLAGAQRGAAQLPHRHQLHQS